MIRRVRNASVRPSACWPLLTGARGASAQTSRLTLADALRIAAGRNESIDIARAGEARADAEQLRVQSLRRPQLSFLGTYSRTLASEFSGAFNSSGPSCAPLAVNASAPVNQRLAELERAAGCGAIRPGPWTSATCRSVSATSISFNCRSRRPCTRAGESAPKACARRNVRRAAGIDDHGRGSAGCRSTSREAFYDAALERSPRHDRRVRLQPGERDVRSDSALVRGRTSAGVRDASRRRSRATSSGRPSFAARRGARSRTSVSGSCSRWRPTRRSRSTSISTRSTSRRRRRSPRRWPPCAAPGRRAIGPTSARRKPLVGAREAGVTVAQAERRPSVALTSSLAPRRIPEQRNVSRHRRLPHELVAQRVGSVPVFDRWTAARDGSVRAGGPRRSAGTASTGTRMVAARFGDGARGSVGG